MTPEVDELARIREAFAGPEPPRRGESPGISAVLLPLYARPDGLHLLYTLRAPTLSRHAGEWSFPGGRVDPTDAGPLGAALRETHEEVGIPPDAVDVVGHLSDMETFYGRLVCAYVGLVAGEPPTTPASVDEVESVHVVPVAHLMDPSRYEARSFADSPRRAVHYWRLEDGVMWGITGEITARFLARAYGWAPPRAPRVIEDVSDFIPG